MNKILDDEFLFLENDSVLYTKSYIKDLTNKVLEKLSIETLDSTIIIDFIYRYYDEVLNFEYFCSFDKFIETHYSERIIINIAINTVIKSIIVKEESTINIISVDKKLEDKDYKEEDFIREQAIYKTEANKEEVDNIIKEYNKRTNGDKNE